MGLDPSGNFVSEPHPADAPFPPQAVFGANPDVVYISDPNTENLTPADPTKPCTAYSKDGSKSFMGWNVDDQRWE